MSSCIIAGRIGQTIYPGVTIASCYYICSTCRVIDYEIKHNCRITACCIRQYMGSTVVISSIGHTIYPGIIVTGYYCICSSIGIINRQVQGDRRITACSISKNMRGTKIIRIIGISIYPGVVITGNYYICSYC